MNEDLQDGPHVARPLRVSLRMVAEKAGVHHSTVSLALRDSPLIAEKTRLRVRAIASGLGYVPDPVLSALNAYRQQQREPRSASTIGWVSYQADRNQAPWTQVKLYREYYAGACKRAAALGYRVEEFPIGPNGYTPKRLQEVLLSRGVQGLLISPHSSSAPESMIDFSRFSVLKFGYSYSQRGLNRVTNHQFLSGEQALQQLRKLGYRRIGIALPLDYHQGLRMQLLGAFWVDYHQQPEAWRVPPMLVEDWGAASLRSWLEQHEPEAVLSDHVTIAPLLEEIGWSVPGQVALASIGLTAEETHYAGIYQNNERIGEVAVNVLSSMIQHNEIGIINSPQNVLIEGEWRDGPSAPGARKNGD